MRVKFVWADGYQELCEMNIVWFNDVPEFPLMQKRTYEHRADQFRRHFSHLDATKDASIPARVTSHLFRLVVFGSSENGQISHRYEYHEVIR